MSGLLSDSTGMTDTHFDGFAVTMRLDFEGHVAVFSVLGDAVNLILFELCPDGLSSELAVSKVITS